MWIKRNTDSPPADGPYTVFGTVNAGTPYEQKSRFVAYWNSSQHAFVDKDGEDLTGINESYNFV